MSCLSIFVHHPLNSHYKDDNDMQCRFSILQYLLLQNTFFFGIQFTPDFFHQISCRALQNGTSGSITRVLVWGKDANSVVTYKSSVRITELPLRVFAGLWSNGVLHESSLSLYLNICEILSTVYCILWSVCICIYIYIVWARLKPSKIYEHSVIFVGIVGRVAAWRFDTHGYVQGIFDGDFGPF